MTDKQPTRYLITGASRGIGRAIARRLAKAGCCLILQGRDRNALFETKREVESGGAAADVYVCDLSDTGQVVQMVDDIARDPLHVLVNNAGITIAKPIDTLTLEDWQTTLAVNVTAPFVLVQKLLPRMPDGAAIVNLLSVAAKTVFPGWSAYCMSKFALDGFSRALREELRTRRIRVINLYPAATNTDLWDGVEGDFPREKMMPPEEVAEALAYALSRPPSVLVEDISVGSIGGNL